MHRFKPLTLLIALLVSCGITAPPRDNAQWSSTVQGVSITWRATVPGAMLDNLKTCGDSLRPLGWVDFAVPRCAEAPDPRTITEGQ